MKRRLAVLLVPLLLAGAVGCTADPAEPSGPTRQATAARPSPFADCAALTAAPTGAPASAPTGAPAAAPAGSSSARPAADAGPLLPELTVPCFTGGAPVALRDIRGPAVINIWASWCPPCRKELPAFQRLSQRSAGQLQVIGVNTQDSTAAAQSIGEDFGVRFPTLVDQGNALQRELKRNAFPLTLFVDGQGRIRHVDASGALDDARLAELVREHLAVAVPA
ncbi:TlpA family protein disulfide reductase [Micromonospora sp. GCM10011542]|uniref:TlpA family protein disulfide reductase n=1 Tax=Micromonospora sp. GCM10011542 TaxID=3317337 RepID=UPI003606002C